MASTPYQPTSRRPIADPLRKTTDAMVRLCVKLNVSPDAISYLSIAFSAIAGLCFWRSGYDLWLVIPAAMGCYGRLYCNMLDGMVALAAQKASRHGEIINEVPDRFSDMLIFIGVAYSGLNHPFWGMLAATLAVLTAYVGVLGSAVGVQREFSGVMSKPWRMVALHIGSWIMLALMHTDLPVVFARQSVMDITLILICLGCLQTVWVRLVRILKAIDQKFAKPAP